MNISLVTTNPEFEENDRIRTEVEALGHTFHLIDLTDFTFNTKDNKFNTRDLTDIKADIVIVRGILRSVLPIVVIIAGLREKGIKVFDNNLLEHKYSIDKVTDLVKLSSSGVPIPDTAYSRNFDNYIQLASDMGYPVIVKRTRTGKGMGVYKFERESELVEFIEKLRMEGQDERGYLLQKYIPYNHDLRCLIIGDQIFTMERIPAEGEFRANFSLGGSVKTYDLDEKSRDLVIRALNTIEMSVGGVDILIAEDKRYILEVNHIAGFLGMEKATGANIGKVYVEHAIENAV